MQIPGDQHGAMKEYPRNVHHGFLIVRLPEYNFDAEDRGAFSKEVPKLGDIYYGGIFRMPWFDLDEDYISGATANNRRKRRGDAQPYWGCLSVPRRHSSCRKEG
jgi:hypothetical protein